MTLKDGYGFGGFSRAPPSKQHLSTPPPPPPGYKVNGQLSTVSPQFDYRPLMFVMPWSKPPRIAILGIWGDTWLNRGKYGIYVTVAVYAVFLRDAFWKVCHVKSALYTVVSPT